MKTFTTLLAAAATCTFIAAPAVAQVESVADSLAGQSPVQLSGDVMAVKITTDASGTERTKLVAPDLIVPGDRLIFGTDYANTSAEPVENFTVTNPLPAAVRLAPDAKANLTVSVDGARTWGVLANLTVASEDGTGRRATHADVTHVRWVLASVAPGESGRLEYPAIIR